MLTNFFRIDTRTRGQQKRLTFILLINRTEQQPTLVVTRCGSLIHVYYNETSHAHCNARKFEELSSIQRAREKGLHKTIFVH